MTTTNENAFDVHTVDTAYGLKIEHGTQKQSLSAEDIV